MGAYCRWYDKEMRDVTEHEQEQCAENGQDCSNCPDVVLKNADNEEENIHE